MYSSCLERQPNVTTLRKIIDDMLCQITSPLMKDRMRILINKTKTHSDAVFHSEQSLNESGQSIVIIAAAFIVLLLFAGIALDVGLGFVRSSTFSRAVDSSSMAGVIDLSDVQINSSCDPFVIDHVGAPILAITRTRQFLGTNGLPIVDDDQLAASISCTDLGLPQYTITVTYQVDTFFTRLVGFNGFPVTHRASAGYYALTDILLTYK